MKYLNMLKNAIFFGLGLFLICICGCQQVQEVLRSDQQDMMDVAPIRVSVVYPGDCLGDSSYCELLYNGVQKTEAALGIEITEIESTAETWDMQLREASKGSDLVITSGFQMGAPLLRVAPEFPEVMFVIFDAEVVLPNVAAFTHRVNEGTFLVGAIAGLKSKTGKVGYLGGADVPLLHQFEAGYVAGVKAVNPDAEIFRNYVADDEQGFYQPMKAEELALAQYENGVDVIYAMADRSGFGAIEAAKTEENRYVIWSYINISAVVPDVVLTSLRVGIDDSVSNIIRDFEMGTFTPGVQSLGLAEGGVGYALDEGNNPLLSDEILMKVDALKAQIISGEIVVPTEPILPRE